MEQLVACITNSKGTAMSPLDAEMLHWFHDEHGRVEPNIFAGEPDQAVREDVEI
jgi:hypothetical protein